MLDIDIETRWAYTMGTALMLQWCNPHWYLSMPPLSRLTDAIRLMLGIHAGDTTIVQMSRCGRDWQLHNAIQTHTYGKHTPLPLCLVRIAKKHVHSGVTIYTTAVQGFMKHAQVIVSSGVVEFSFTELYTIIYSL